MEPEFARRLQNIQFEESPLQPIHDPWLAHQQINLWLKRDDLLHPIISGNKWRKLKYSLQHALSLGCNTLVSMGGAYSNHLHALAFAGQQLGFQTKGLIRGEPSTPLNPTLQDLQDWGMTLEFVSRSEYRQLRQYQHWHALPGLSANQYWLPEGGAGQWALPGVAELLTEITIPYDYLCVACGTGTTLAGLLTQGLRPTTLMGFAAFKNAGFLNAEVARQLNEPTLNHWLLNLDYHFGGFAKVTPSLLRFIQHFEQMTDIALDPIYTGKMLYGLYDLIGQGYFKPGQSIIALHSGGLQGRRSGLMNLDQSA